MNWIYVQAQFGKQCGDDEIWFRHCEVEAPDEESAYIEGQRRFPTMDADAQMLNDYVIAKPLGGRVVKNARWAKPKA